MFTGIVEEIGLIKSFDGLHLNIQCSKVLEGTKLGDSISVSGCCQTVTDFDKNSFSVNLSKETISLIKNLKAGDYVNLERALMPSSRLGGHIVQGHIDGKAKYLGNFRFELPKELAKYAIYKGSICIDGVSLTISNIEDNVFEVAVIEHTLKNTTLQYLKPNDYVNIETDILGRYIEKFLSRDNNVISNITEEFLVKNGF